MSLPYKKYLRTGLFLITFSAIAISGFTLLRKESTGYESEENEAREAESALGYVKWRNEVLANQVTGQVDLAEVARIDKELMAKAALNKTNAGMDWVELGPDNVGGRTRSMIVDRNNSNILFAGGVSGGIWKSTTAGGSWTRVNDQMSTLNICALTQTANGDIYAGTGEIGIDSRTGASTYTSFTGQGVFKSTDGGTSFTLLSSTDASASGKTFWAATSDMKADPVNANKVYAGNLNGLYITNDGGGTWTKAITNPSTSGNCTDIDISPDGSVVAAVIGISIYISTDAGASFTRLTPTNTIWGGTPSRISLAIAPSNSNYIYAMAGNAASERLLSMCQSKDKGQTWTKIVTGSTPYVDILSNTAQGQAWWNNVTGVDPDDPEHAYFGGIDMYDWTPVAGLTQISNSQLSTLSTKYVHADNHAIVWDTKTSPATMYVCNDGGVFKSKDKGLSFAACNHGYSTTQFYAVTAAYIRDDIRDGWVVGGGAQDNGSWVLDNLGNTPLSGVKVRGGDGFHAALSKKIPGYGIFSYTESTMDSYLKFTPRDNDATQAYDQTFYSDRVAQYCKDSGLFKTPFQLWESPNADSVSLFLFAARGSAWFAKDVYADLTKVPNWYRIMLFSGNGTCVDMSQDGNSALIGTSVGTVYLIDSIRTKGIFDSANASLSNVNIKLVFSAAGRYVNGVSFSKTDKSKAVVTLGNYGNNDYIYSLTNLNTATPTSASAQGNLPKIPVYDAEILWDNANTVVVGTERGIYVSNNFNAGSPTYAAENNGMALVPVYQVEQYKFNNWPGSRFYIATHGRGFFASTTYAHTGVNAIAEKKSSLSIYPNPARTITTFSFNATRSGKAQVSVYNLSGQLVRAEEINTTSGTNNYSFFVDGLANGNYLAVVTHDGTRETRKLVVLK